MKHAAFARLLLGGLLATAIACDGDTTGPNGDLTTLLSVTPAGGATDVDPNTTVAIEFGAAMHGETYAALHAEDMTGMYGPLVNGTWSWSQDSSHLTFTPDAPLMPDTRYTLHIGGGMMDAAGNVIDLAAHGPGMGGQWITQTMMQGCAMQVCGGMTGQGWMHPDNGSFGMGFTFTTAAAPALLSVTPSGGTMGVDPSTNIDLEFSHAMHGEMHAALHERDMTGRFGPLVMGTWNWSADSTHLTFMPDSALHANTDYTIHIGGGMMDATGHVIDLGEHGPGMGGQWVTQQMMQGCMMQVCGGMMGPGWMHPENGSYGMSFTFHTN